MQVLLNDVRKKYLDFFASKQHAVISSARLVPENDPTTLFTGSGMQPMISYLLGQKHPNGVRITDSQKCLRVQDIDDIGDNRHTTFFEMLGNWSLGDYFKQEQIPWMFEFLTDAEKGLGLDASRIYVTIFAGNDAIGIPKDMESAELWGKAFATKDITAEIIDNSETDGMQGGRIFSYNEKKNWWSRAGIPENMPVGEPGGPDTEMFWDFSPEDKSIHANSSYKDQPCHVNCDCGRFMEIGNNVFMQYVKTDSGFQELPQRNVDFGGGLERLTAAAADNPDVFLIDAFEPMLDVLKNQYGIEYATTNSDDKKSLRIVLDHIRAAVFLVGDGILPSKKERGYVLRRLIRRAVFNSNKLIRGFSNVYPLVDAVIDQYSETYNNLGEMRQKIHEIIEKEEMDFGKTLKIGLKEYSKWDLHVSGGNASTLASTYGFPVELTKELAKEYGKTLSENFDEEFAKDQERHKEISRKGAEQKFKGGLADHSDMSVKYHTATHLLHKALKQILGDHVQQKGSNITPERLRFDFSHPDKMTPEQIKEVEDVVNKQIQKDMIVTREEMSVAKAKEKGALGLFEHKYGDTVSVYTMGDFSCEICGGPHVEHTGVLGTFKIMKEESASAGVRRIKAILA